MSEPHLELPGWKFDVQEISVGVYLVRGIDQRGRSVEATGTDPDALLETCRQAAVEMQFQSTE